MNKTKKQAWKQVAQYLKPSTYLYGIMSYNAANIINKTASIP